MAHTLAPSTPRTSTARPSSGALVADHTPPRCPFCALSASASRASVTWPRSRRSFSVFMRGSQWRSRGARPGRYGLVGPQQTCPLTFCMVSAVPGGPALWPCSSLASLLTCRAWPRFLLCALGSAPGSPLFVALPLPILARRGSSGLCLWLVACPRGRLSLLRSLLPGSGALAPALLPLTALVAGPPCRRLWLVALGWCRPVSPGLIPLPAPFFGSA